MRRHVVRRTAGDPGHIARTIGFLVLLALGAPAAAAADERADDEERPLGTVELAEEFSDPLTTLLQPDD